MPKPLLSIDEIYASQECDGSVFKAVVMMAQEARFINEQANLGNIELTKKPTTIAMHKFKNCRLEDDGSQESATLEIDTSIEEETTLEVSSEVIGEIE